MAYLETDVTLLMMQRFLFFEFGGENRAQNYANRGHCFRKLFNGRRSIFKLITSIKTQGL